MFTERDDYTCQYSAERGNHIACPPKRNTNVIRTRYATSLPRLKGAASGSTGAAIRPLCMHVDRYTLVALLFCIHVPKSARRNKLQLIREREAVKARLGRLQTMLLQKLTHKYGSKRWAQDENHAGTPVLQ